MSRQINRHCAGRAEIVKLGTPDTSAVASSVNEDDGIMVCMSCVIRHVFVCFLSLMRAIFRRCPLKFVGARAVGMSEAPEHLTGRLWVFQHPLLSKRTLIRKNKYFCISFSHLPSTVHKPIIVGQVLVSSYRSISQASRFLVCFFLQLSTPFGLPSTSYQTALSSCSTRRGSCARRVPNSLSRWLWLRKMWRCGTVIDLDLLVG